MSHTIPPPRSDGSRRRRRACGFAGALGLVLGEADTSGGPIRFSAPQAGGVGSPGAAAGKRPIVAGVAALFVAAPVIYLERSTAASRRIGEIEKQIAESEGKQGDNKKFLDFGRERPKFDSGQHVWV